MKGQRKTRHALAIITTVPAQIRTKHLPHTTQTHSRGGRQIIYHQWWLSLFSSVPPAKQRHNLLHSHPFRDIQSSRHHCGLPLGLSLNGVNVSRMPRRRTGKARYSSSHPWTRYQTKAVANWTLRRFHNRGKVTPAACGNTTVGGSANQPGHVGEEKKKNPCPTYKTQPAASRLTALLVHKPTTKSKKIFKRVQRTLFYKAFRLC